MADKNTRYRIDNGGCRGAFVPGFGDKYYWETVDEACEAAKILHENSNRKYPYEIVAIDISRREGGFFNSHPEIRVELVINED